MMQQQQQNQPELQEQQQLRLESRMIRLSAWESICMELVNKLMNHRDAWPFEEPVDPQKWDVPDYFDVIKEPMDLTTIKNQLVGKQYQHFSQLLDHVLLVFDNAMKYNPPYNPVYSLAERMQKSAARHAQQLLPKLNAAANAAGAGAAKLTPSVAPLPAPAGSRPLAPIHPFSPERLLVTLHRINALAPFKQQAGEASGPASDAGLGPGRGAGRRKRRGVDGRGGDSDDGREAASSPSPWRPEEAQAASDPAVVAPKPIPLAVLIQARGLPDLPQGFYLASPNPPTRFLTMPSRSNGVVYSLESFDPELTPNWQQHERRWREIQMHQALTPSRKLQRIVKAAPAAPRRPTPPPPGGPDSKDSNAVQTKAPKPPRAVQGPPPVLPMAMQTMRIKEQRDHLYKVVLGVEPESAGPRCRSGSGADAGGGKVDAGAGLGQAEDCEQQQEQRGKALAPLRCATPSPPGSSLDVAALDMSIVTFADAKTAFEGSDHAASPFFLDVEMSASPSRGLAANCWSGSNSSSRGQPPASWGALQPDLPLGAAPQPTEAGDGRARPEEAVAENPCRTSDGAGGGGAGGRFGAGGGEQAAAAAAQVAAVSTAKLEVVAEEGGGCAAVQPMPRRSSLGGARVPCRVDDYLSLGGAAGGSAADGAGAGAASSARPAAAAADATAVVDMGEQSRLYFPTEYVVAGSHGSKQHAAGASEVLQANGNGNMNLNGVDEADLQAPATGPSLLEQFEDKCAEAAMLRSQNEHLHNELQAAQDLITWLRTQLSDVRAMQQHQQPHQEQYDPVGLPARARMAQPMHLLPSGRAMGAGPGLVLVPMQSLHPYPMQAMQQHHMPLMQQQQQQVVQLPGSAEDQWQRSPRLDSLDIPRRCQPSNHELTYW